MPFGILAVLVIALLSFLGIGGRWYLHGDFNVVHTLFSLFFSTNLLICYWEMCLYFGRDRIPARTEYWHRRQRETGRTAAFAFLSSRMSPGRFLSRATGADVWAAYSTIDPSYTDRRTLGFTADVGNGFVTPFPTLFLYVAYTLDFVPAVVAGIVGAMLFWQWAYVSSLYWVSFLVAGRHNQDHVTRGELYVYVGVLNAIWVLFGVFGMYVSVRLILEGGYGVLGY